MAPEAAFRFGPFVLCPSTFRLQSARGDVSLSPRAADLLLLLVQRAGRLVTKTEIFGLLWADLAVTDNALTQVVSEVRRALGDSTGSPRYVQTLARRGYRFVAPVRVTVPLAAGPAPARASDEEAPAPGRRDVRLIRVDDFANVSRDRQFAWLATGIAEALAYGLRVVPGLRVVDCPDPTSDFGEIASDFIVVGAFQRLGDQLRITARVVDARTREAVAHAMVDGPRLAAFALQDALARDLVVSLAAMERNAVRYGVRSSTTTAVP